MIRPFAFIRRYADFLAAREHLMVTMAQEMARLVDEMGDLKRRVAKLERRSPVEVLSDEAEIVERRTGHGFC